MKKRIIIIFVIILLICLMPIPNRLKDGGSIEYISLVYKITKVHRLNALSITGYEDGWIIEIFGVEIYNETNIMVNPSIADKVKNNHIIGLEWK